MDAVFEGGEGETEEGEETVETVGEDLGVPRGEREREEREKGVQHSQLLLGGAVKLSPLEGSTQNLVTGSHIHTLIPS